MGIREWSEMPSYGDLVTARPEPFAVRERNGEILIVDARGEEVAVMRGSYSLANARILVAASCVRMEASEAVDEAVRLGDEVEELEYEKRSHDFNEREVDELQDDLDEALGVIEKARDAVEAGAATADIFEMLNRALPFPRELQGKALEEKLKGLMSAGGGA